MAGSWPKSQVDAQRKRITEGLTMSKSDATKVAPSNHLTAVKPVTLSASDALSAHEFILFAAESMQGVIDWEITSGRERPIVESMREYVRDARRLLERLK